MKKYTLLLLITVHFITTTGIAQPLNNNEYEKEFENEGIDPNLSNHKNTEWYLLMKQNNPNVYKVKKAYTEYFKNNAFTRSYETNEYRKWIRENWRECDDTGTLLQLTPTPQAVKNWQKQQQNQPQKSAGIWQDIGPMSWDKNANMQTGSPGVGVIRSLAFDPNNTNKLFCGTVSGGIWRSTNAGTNWSSVGTNLLASNVTGIAVAKSNSNIVYAATNVGVVKSTDGGTIWNYTNLNSTGTYPTGGYNPQGIVISPTDPNIVVFATGSGLWRSTDGGNTWNQQYSGRTVWDIEWHPTNNNIVYIAIKQSNQNWVQFYRSIDAGLNFTNVTTGYPVYSAGKNIGRVCIAVTPAAPNTVVAFAAGGDGNISGLYGIYTSTDAGVSFTHTCCGAVDGPENHNGTTNPNLLDYSSSGNGGGQYDWDMGLAIADNNANFLLAGGVFTYKSTNGGTSWTATPGIHYDVQCLTIGNNGNIFIGTDGGVYNSTDNMATVVPKTEGISTTEIWGFGQSFKNDIMAIGAYHLPTIIRDDNIYENNGYTGGWYAWAGADAMGANVNPNDDKWIYGKPWSSSRAKRANADNQAPQSYDLGIDLGYITLNNLEFDPQLHYKIYGMDYTSGSERLVNTTDNANTWTTLKTGSFYRIKVCNKNPNVIYALGENNLIWKTINGGTNWTDASPTATERANQSISDIAVNDQNENEIWISLGGHQTTKKVIKSINGGDTYTDISGTLPASAIRTLIHQRGSNGAIYLGTSLGVYYRNASMSDWLLYAQGLPATDVNFLHINYAKSKIRAATNRGIWENDLYEAFAPAAQISANTNIVNCTRDTIYFVDYSAHAAGATFQWSFPGGNPATSTLQQPKVTYSANGNYAVSLTVTDPNGTSSQNLNNFITVDNKCGIDTIPGYAALLNGTSAYIEVPPLNITTNTITIMAWVKPNGIQPDYSGIFIADGSPAAGFNFKDGNNTIGYHWANGSWWWSSGLTAPPGKWSHVAMVVKPDTLTLYVNGVPSSQVINLAPLSFNTTARLGNYQGWGDRFYKGLIDEVAIYNTALTKVQVREQMHLTKKNNDPNLIRYYQFNNLTTNSTELDKIGTKHATLLQEATRIKSTGPFAGGKSVRKKINSSGTYNFAGTGITLNIATGIVPNGEVVVNRLHWQPDTLPNCSAYFSDKWYWIINNYGTNQNFTMLNSIKFDSLYVPSLANLNTNTYTLYSRPFYADLATWATSISTPSSATEGNFGNFLFGANNNVTSFGQFIITNSMVVQNINGNNLACINGIESYSVAPVLANSVTYNWQIMSGSGTIISGQGTSNIQVQWAAGVAGQVKVTITY